MTDSPRLARLQAILAGVFNFQREEWKKELPPAEYERRRHDFVFHLTDWQSDLEGLAALFKDPDGQDDDASHSFIIGFLYHIVPHVDAAARLLLGDIGNPFPDPCGDADPGRRHGGDGQ